MRARGVYRLKSGGANFEGGISPKIEISIRRIDRRLVFVEDSSSDLELENRKSSSPYTHFLRRQFWNYPI